MHSFQISTLVILNGMALRSLDLSAWRSMLEAQEERKECFVPWAFIPLILTRLRFLTHTHTHTHIKAKKTKTIYLGSKAGNQIRWIRKKGARCGYSLEGSWFMSQGFSP